MYLSIIKKLQTVVDHRLIMKGFPDVEVESPRQHFQVLFRVEPDGSTLVQSGIHPNWANVLPRGAVQTKEYTVPSLDVGDRYLFRLGLASRSSNKGGREGTHRVYKAIPPNEWLSKRELGAQFDVRGVSRRLVSDVSSSRARVALTVSTVEGYLTVTDPDTLTHKITHGLGKGRAYGCGLLSVKKTQGV